MSDYANCCSATLKEDFEHIRRLSELTNIIPVIAKSDLVSQDVIDEIKAASIKSFTVMPKLPAFGTPETVGDVVAAVAPYTISSANGPDTDTMDASLLMSPEYVQPLVSSELVILVQQLFDADTVAYLRHSAAKKLVTWHATHPKLTRVPSPSIPSAHHSTITSPIGPSLTNSGVLIPIGSDISLNTSNSYALAKIADHTQREERLAQVRLSKWASDLQLSLQRERERYERLARGDRAIWLLERMGAEAQDGHLIAVDGSQAMVRTAGTSKQLFFEMPAYAVHDPLGLLRWQDTMRTRGWIALQVVGSFGVMGGLALWLAKTWGFSSSLNDWVAECGNWLGLEE